MNKYDKIWFRFDNIFVFQNYLKDEASLKAMSCSNCSFSKLGIPITNFSYSILFFFVFTRLPESKFANKLAANVFNKILRNQKFDYFDTFSIVSRISFINKSYYLRDLSIFMVSFISSLDIINVIVHCAISEGHLKSIIFMNFRNCWRYCCWKSY